MPDSEKKVLHLMLSASAESMPYNEFVLASPSRDRIAMCNYFAPTITVPEDVESYTSDGTLRGYLRTLNRVLNSDTFDIVHAHTPHVALLLIACQIFYRVHVPPAVFTLHTSFANVRLRNRLMLLLVFSLFHKIICCSRTSLESLPRPLRFIAGKRLGYVANGVNISRVDSALLTVSNESQGRPFSIVWVGRFIKVKNIETAISTLIKMRDSTVYMTFIGDGPLGIEVRNRIESCGLNDRVRLTGVLEREEVLRHLAQADLFLSTSRVEGLPVAVLEAMACRCPVVLSDIPPHREIAGDDGIVPLVSPENSEGFAQQILNFTNISREARLQFGERCRRRVETNFNVNVMLTEYERIYSAERYRRGRSATNRSGTSFDAGELT